MRRWKKNFFCAYFKFDIAEKDNSKIHMIIMRLIILCFMAQISISVLSGGVVYSHGLFGELREAIVVQENRSNKQEVFSKATQKLRTEKGCNVYNICFLLLAVVICICYEAYYVKNSPPETMVALKVRMNN